MWRKHFPQTTGRALGSLTPSGVSEPGQGSLPPSRLHIDQIKSQVYLGAQYRRLRTRLGAPKAITPMARKLAWLFYRLLTRGQKYVDRGAEYYETRHR